ncbi:MAG: tryptophan synthase subunit alpha [Gammaproteobacteria bacterium]|nr:tryptophan synthase subunit alpha [Gammaproteobacteria bacterium]
MSRYQSMFNRLSEENRGAFIPFVTIGDPNLDTSYKVIKTLIESGADALELGLPFSDPIADGPTIQNANIRALQQEITTQDCLNVIAKIRSEFQDTPIGLLLYSNLIMAKGVSNFYQSCADAGVDSVLVADVPVRESQPFRKIAEQTGIAPVFIVPPTISDEGIRQVASYSRGYTYLLSRAGVTGAETKANMPAEAMIGKLNEYHAAPPVLGFGISSPEQVKEAIKSGAKGAISGSAVVQIIEKNLGNEQQMLTELSSFITAMKAAS